MVRIMAKKLNLEELKKLKDEIEKIQSAINNEIAKYLEDTLEDSFLDDELLERLEAGRDMIEEIIRSKGISF